MSTKSRTAARAVLGTAIAMLLAGCIRVDMDLEVSPENTVSGNAVIAVDENLVRLSGQSVEDVFSSTEGLSDLPPGASVDPYDEDGFVGQRITFDEVSLSEFSQSQSLGGSGDDLSITRVGDEFHVSGRLDMTGAEFNTGQVPQQFLDTFEFRISLTFPGPVTSATGAIDGNTVTWEPKIGQDTQITAVASAIPSSSSPWLLIVLVIAAALVVAAVLFLLFGRRRQPATADGTAAPPTSDGAASATATTPVTPAPPVPSDGAEPPVEEEPPPVPPVSD